MTVLEQLRNLKAHFWGVAAEEIPALQKMAPPVYDEIEMALRKSGSGKITALPDGGTVEDLPDGAKIFRNKLKLLDRDQGAAVLLPNGSKGWYKNGVCTRKEWFRDGQSHRDDGTTVQNANGTAEWYSPGRKLAETPVLEVAAPKGA